MCDPIMLYFCNPNNPYFFNGTGKYEGWHQILIYVKEMGI